MAESASQAGGPGPMKVRFGYTLLQFVLVNVVPLAVLGVLWLLGVFDSVPWLLWVLLAILLLSSFYWGSTLTQTHLIVHNARRRKLAWSDIDTISTDTNLGQKTIVVTELSGRQTRLRAPTTGTFAWDKRFDQKFQALGEWYLARR